MSGDGILMMVLMLLGSAASLAQAQTVSQKTSGARETPAAIDTSKLPLDLARIQRLMQATSPEVRAEIIKNESAQLDETFFALYGRLAEAAAADAPEREELVDGQELVHGGLPEGAL